MRQIIDLVQGSPEWLAHRLKYRNASETPAVMGLSPWVTPEQLREIRTGKRVQEVTYPMRRGMMLEPKARATYEDETGIVMEPAVMVDGEYSSSLDGLTFQGDLILEIKCPMKGRESETWEAVAGGVVPEHYYYQVQHQLMVSGAELCHFYVYDDKEGMGTMIEVQAVPEHIQRLQEAWESFLAVPVLRVAA